MPKLVIASAVAASAILAQFILRPGMPLFLHDWSWSPFPAAVQFTAVNLYSAWIPNGLGEPNSVISANPLSWLKPLLGYLPSGKASMLCYLWLCMFFTMWGVSRLISRILAASQSLSLIGGALFVLSPFFFAKIAAGQSSYWAASAAFVWALSFAIEGTRRNDWRAISASGACFSLATIQLQFFVFALVALVAIWLERPSIHRSLQLAVIALATATLAFPEIVMLWQHGPVAGAGISPPYSYWTASQSPTMHDALVLFGYTGKYPERALGNALLQHLTFGAALFMTIWGAMGAVLSIRKREFVVFIFILIGTIGYFWVAGVNGPFAPIWTFAISHFQDAAFLREFYHAGILLLVGQIVLFISSLRFLNTRSAAIVGLLSLILFAAPFELDGIGRVVSFVRIPTAYTELQATSGRAVGTAMFLPIARPLALSSGAIGGTEGLDWIGPSETSLYEYYPAPLVALAARFLHEGNANGAGPVLRDMSCNAIIVRNGVVSLSMPTQDARRLGATIRKAGGSVSIADPALTAYSLSPEPFVDVAKTVAPQPSDSRSEFRDRVTYLDYPGTAAQNVASFQRASAPDPRKGWTDVRDVLWDRGIPLNALSYGLVTMRRGESIRFNGRGTADAIMAFGRFSRNGGGGFDAFHHAELPRGVPLQFSRPIIFSEIGEEPVRERVAPGVVITEQRDALWSFRGVLELAGRSAIILRQSYDDGWKIDVPGARVIRHLRADGAFNAWIVKGNGRFDFRLFYAPQSSAFILLGISAFLWVVVVLGALGIQYGRFRFIR